jgi:hypothetical protein
MVDPKAIEAIGELKSARAAAHDDQAIVAGRKGTVG